MQNDSLSKVSKYLPPLVWADKMSLSSSFFHWTGAAQNITCFFDSWSWVVWQNQVSDLDPEQQ